MNIFIGSLIRNCEWILPEFLKRILDLNYSKKDLTLCFILNDSIDKSEMILHAFAERFQNDYNKIIIAKSDFKEDAIGAGSSRLNGSDPLGRHTNASTGDRGKLYVNLADLRNLMMKIFTERSEAEWMISIDSDILINPETVNLLIDGEKPSMRGAMVINDFLLNPDMEFNPLYRHCNVGIETEKGIIRHKINYELNKIYDVDVTGACFSIHRKIVPLSSYKYHTWGEDAGYCVDLPEDTKIEWDTRCVQFHVMEKAMISQEEEFWKELENVRLCSSIS